MWWALGGVLLGVAVLVAVIVLAKRGGRAEAQVDQAEGERDAATDQAERMARPMPTQGDRARSIRRRLRELGLSDDEIDAALRRAERGGEAGDSERPSG